MMTVTASFTEENSMILSVANSPLDLTVTLMIAIGSFLATIEPHILQWHAKLVFSLASMNRDVPRKVLRIVESNKQLPATVIHNPDLVFVNQYNFQRIDDH
ncbi:uncharacterized protein LOC128248079 [Octopus bimaculoides]|uniref:uncharacterized protein LOC128248079 n=1 Tax=Octopus bimaculoides TaxID=37653 RepID=UPI0022E46D0A|nr:uncharacterized protein LOC128248079 [Octopus bimaculoides]